MATSPLFGWEEPDDTDLVKDGAAAIRTLGNAIDTSMGDLLGGTTGQVLSKNSNTNMDFTWVTSDDANAIQNAIVDAKGDLIAATAADTPARLAVGTNGQYLQADSTAATGLKWATPSPSYKGVSCYLSATQNTTAGVLLLLPFGNENWDTDAFHSTSSNTSRITIPAGLGGYYLFNGYVATSTSDASQIVLYKNGSALALGTASGTLHRVVNTAGNTIYYTASLMVSAVATDYFEMGVTNYTANKTVDNAVFTMTYIGA